MSAIALSHPQQEGRRRRDRLAAGFVLVVLGLSCLAFMTALPLGGLWVLSKITEDSATHFVGGLVGIPVLMACVAPLLFWLNRLYLRISATAADYEEEDEELEGRRLRGPLEPMLLVSFVIALTALTIWFFFFAENPTRSFW